MAMSQTGASADVYVESRPTTAHSTFGLASGRAATDALRTRGAAFDRMLPSHRSALAEART